MDPVMEHAKKIESLRQIEPEMVLAAQLNALLQAVRDKELSVQDVLQFTNITGEQLHTLLDKSK